MESSCKFIEVTKQFSTFIKSESQTSENFKYWSIFLDEIFPVLNDLTQSFCQSDWCKHLSAVRRAIPLFFAFGHTNYPRWAPLYYEECLNLQKTFPLIHKSFLNGDFVAHYTNRKGSGVPIDQTLEFAYNKPAKGPGGVIGISKKKRVGSLMESHKTRKSKIYRRLDQLYL